MTKKKVNEKPSETKKTVSNNKKSSTIISKSYTKTEILSDLAQSVDLSKRQIDAVIDSLENLIARHLKKGAVGAFILPGLLKIQAIHKPATKARKGINPFTGQPAVFKAKPAHYVVKVRALKKLKSMV